MASMKKRLTGYNRPGVQTHFAPTALDLKRLAKLLTSVDSASEEVGAIVPAARRHGEYGSQKGT